MERVSPTEGASPCSGPADGDRPARTSRRAPPDDTRAPAPGAGTGARGRRERAAVPRREVAQPLTEPSMMPETKYRCTKANTHRITMRIRISVTDWMFALRSLTEDPEAAAPAEAAVEAPAMRFRRHRVTGTRSVRSR